MAEKDIIEQSLKELLEKKSREERKANGRLVAVLVAFLVIFLAIYHAWIRKTAVLAGVLVPALIMISYGGWVVMLAKRDKRKQAIFERHIEELAQQTKAQRLAKKNVALIKKKKKRPYSIVKDSPDPNKTTKLHYENEKISKTNKSNKNTLMDIQPNTLYEPLKKDDNRFRDQKTEKHRKHKQRRKNGNQSSSNSSGSNSSKQSPTNHPNKSFHTKRPSFRQKLFRQNAAAQIEDHGNKLHGISVFVTPKKKKLQRLNAVSSPLLERGLSAPY